jgi:hypothetical protein
MQNRLTLRESQRTGGGGRTPRTFLDFVVDGRSLYDLLVSRGFDSIPCLGWGPLDSQKAAVERLLRRKEPDFPNERTSLFVCAECGDLDCGAVSVMVERAGDEIVWRDFAFENTYDSELQRDRLEDVGPFRFNGREYLVVLAQSTERAPPRAT